VLFHRTTLLQFFDRSQTVCDTAGRLSTAKTGGQVDHDREHDHGSCWPCLNPTHPARSPGWAVPNVPMKQCGHMNCFTAEQEKCRQWGARSIIDHCSIRCPCPSAGILPTVSLCDWPPGHITLSAHRATWITQSGQQRTLEAPPCVQRMKQQRSVNDVLPMAQHESNQWPVPTSSENPNQSNHREEGREQSSIQPSPVSSFFPLPKAISNHKQHSRDGPGVFNRC